MSTPMCLTLAPLRATRTLLGQFINMSLMADWQLMAVTEVIIVYSKSKTIWNLYSENKIHFCSSLLVNQYHPPQLWSHPQTRRERSLGGCSPTSGGAAGRLFLSLHYSGLYCLIMSEGSYKSIAGSDQHLPAAKERGGDGGGRPAVDSPSQVTTTTSIFITLS